MDTCARDVERATLSHEFPDTALPPRGRITRLLREPTINKTAHRGEPLFPGYSDGSYTFGDPDLFVTR